MEAGIDSLSSVEFRNLVQNRFAIEVSSNMLFNYPTIEKIVDYIHTSINKHIDNNEFKHSDEEYNVSYTKVDNKIVNLRIIRDGIGEIRFLGSFSSGENDLDNKIDDNDINQIRIERDSIYLYENVIVPLVGTRLNKPAIITLYHYTDPIDDISGNELENNIREVFAENNFTFIELDYYTGLLQYRVEHF